MFISVGCLAHKITEEEGKEKSVLKHFIIRQSGCNHRSQSK